uniref:Uncharacterized protein n=1 Tax=Rhizophora mucronata TaxID=61149 RepID=A0A2P2PVA8_RHIMU
MLLVVVTKKLCSRCYGEFLHFLRFLWTAHTVLSQIHNFEILCVFSQGKRVLIIGK